MVAGNRDKKRKTSISQLHHKNDYVLCAQILQKIYLQKQKSQVFGGTEIIISMMLNSKIELILPDELNYLQKIYAYKILTTIVVIQFKKKTNIDRTSIHK